VESPIIIFWTMEQISFSLPAAGCSAAIIGHRHALCARGPLKIEAGPASRADLASLKSNHRRPLIESAKPMFFECSSSGGMFLVCSVLVSVGCP
jgi:hypothetical protein